MVKKVSKKPLAKKPEIKSSSKNRQGGLILKEILDISYSEKLLNELLDFIIKSGGKVNIDASQVNRITTPCVQVILSMFLKCYQESVDLKIISASDNFRAAFVDLGLEDELKKYSV
ncbi:MAG TPA: hypothetical protein DIV86_07510 [Alphaproteobacteria bacterium]|nr:hypothetical protein [Alphaproteobacteria bacterium]